MHEDTPALDTSFHDHEMAVDTNEDRRWSRWLDKVSDIMGFDRKYAMDGDGATDGYSLDECFDWYRDGWSPERAANTINTRLAVR